MEIDLLHVGSIDRIYKNARILCLLSTIVSSLLNEVFIPSSNHRWSKEDNFEIMWSSCAVNILCLFLLNSYMNKCYIDLTTRAIRYRLHLNRKERIVKRRR
ncbi:hypothetical protein PFISCL1PPCAC_21802 [Pristionchus fissidentatus]|uniref:G protein-coupled receptor n=1 Tax=Pristionchus fissidentatus TaxID=1538716 RepID=A0AAV5WIW2_9BILA|nr:hypothetical protein PFISCL1PPCAC_21802 [Pristionchus fissidentatus]